MDVEEQIKLFREFIEERYYTQLLEESRKGKNFFVLDFFELTKFNTELAEELLEMPEEIIKAGELAVKEFDLPKKVRRFYLRFRNFPESQKILLNEIRSEHLGKFVWTEGIVRQKSDVRPHVTSAKFECPSCGNILNILQLDKKFKEPTRCACGRKGKFKELSKELVDGQGLVLEEAPEDLEGGAQPKRMNVLLKNDLVSPVSERKTAPGNKVRIFGWVTEIPINLRSGGKSTKFDLMIEANNMEAVEEDYSDIEITGEEIEQIEELAKDPEVYEKIIASLAPSIYGHDKIKEALLLQLVGGAKKERPDGTVTRGDIHILLIGDPGSGKSALLKRIVKVAPKARYTSGKGASGAGLTAAVVKDEFLGGWSLEAGTLVLAHRGFCAIDELDKMTKEDRSALHEGLEQQSYHPETEIMLADGSAHQIGKLVDRLMSDDKKSIIIGKNCEVLPTDVQLLTTDFKKVFPITANRVSRHIAPDHFIEIAYTNGRKMLVTPEHPVFVFDSEIRTIPADQLTLGLLCPAPRIFPTKSKVSKLQHIPLSSSHKPISFPETVNQSFARFAGYFISEGHSYRQPSNHYAEIGITNSNPAINQEVYQLMTNIFETTINTQIVTAHQRKKATVDVTTTRCCSEPLYGFFTNNFKELLSKAPTKRIPNTLRTAPNNLKIELLQTAFSGDGFIDSERFGYSTASLNLAKDYQDLLLHLGIYSYIATETRDETQYYKVVVSGLDSMKKFVDDIVENTDHRLQRLQEFIRRSRQKNNDRDVLPLTVARTLKTLLSQLRLDDGYFFNIIKRKHNVHRKTLQRYLKKIESRIRESEEAILLGNMRNIRKKTNIQVTSLASSMNVSSATIYNFEKRNDQKLKNVIISLAQKKLSKLKTEIEKFRQFTESDIRFVEVKSVRKIKNKGVKWVYDVTVEPTHTFISEGLVLHNTVSISKANIQATLRCETTVLAAANPKFGRFDPYDLIASQINLPPALINRFDLIFPIKDLPDRSKDEKMASHILSLHQDPESMKAKIPTELLKKYIAYSRQKIRPKITDTALKELKEYYITMRNSGSGDEAGVKSIPITARQLEALVRLSEGAAKVRLSSKVTKKDAQRAIELINYCLSQVARDTETGVIDIDRISSGITASQRSKISIVKDIINTLEAEFGKVIPIEHITKQAEERKVKIDEVEEILEKLRRSGDIFEPRRGHIQKL